MSAALAIGNRVGDYEVLRPLCAGGMAKTYVGRRRGAEGFSRPVAIKVIHQHLSDDSSFVSMFVDEAKLAARVHHPNVVHVEQLGRVDDTFFLVMEYVEGCALSKSMRALAKRQRRMAPQLAVAIAARAAAGLHAAHEAVGDDGEPLELVHRDVSPQNVLISETGQIKLIDFGVAKARGRASQTTSASLKGKLRYMSPEQAWGRHVDRRSDVYALGIILWEMLTMRRLFGGKGTLRLIDMVRNPVIERPDVVNPSVPSELADVVMAALSVDPNDRPATAEELRIRILAAAPRARRIDDLDLAMLVAVANGSSDVLIERSGVIAIGSYADETIRDVSGRGDMHPPVREVSSVTELEAPSPSRWKRWVLLAAAPLVAALVWLPLQSGSQIISFEADKTPVVAEQIVSRPAVEPSRQEVAEPTEPVQRLSVVQVRTRPPATTSRSRARRAQFATDFDL